MHKGGLTHARAGADARMVSHARADSCTRTAACARKGMLGEKSSVTNGQREQLDELSAASSECT